MKAAELFLKSIELGYHMDRMWCLDVCSLPYGDVVNARPYYPNFSKGIWGYHDDNGKMTPILDQVFGQPLFPIKGELKLKPGDLANVSKPVTTNYGSAIFNACVFIWPFGAKVEYIAERINNKMLEKIVVDANAAGNMTVDEYLKHKQALGYITLFSQIAVPAATPKSITPSPEAIRIRDELLEKYKDQLEDPAIVALIEKAVVDAYKEYMKGDDAERFILKDKGYSTVLKKMYVMQGGVSKFDDPTKVDTIPRSLADGIAPEDLPAIVNNLRSGSYDRGAETALGGEAAKFSNRVYQNTKIALPDCESKIGLPVEITKANAKEYKGRYLVGSKVPLDDAALNSHLGKVIIIRSPAACKVDNGNFCAVCMGDSVANAGLGIGPQCSSVGSVFLSISLSKFHQSALSTTKYIPAIAIS